MDLRADLRAILVREVLWHDQHRIHPDVALRCTPAIALIVLAGALTGRTGVAAIICGGALTVGSGVYQRLAQSQIGPMLAAMLGMGLSAGLGTLAGLSPPVLVAAVAAWGFAAGLLPALGSGPQWVGQQCAVAFLVASSFPGDVGHAAIRAGLVMAGGAVQIVTMEALLRFGDFGTELAGWSQTCAHARAAWRTLAAALDHRSVHARFALRMAATLSASVVTELGLALPNGYWAGMTALLLLRPDFHDTWHRSASRVLGTLAGAGAAWLVVRADPSGWLVAAAIPVLAFLCFAFQQYSYAVFSLFLTAYIVLLLSFGGLAGPVVAHNRVIGTLLGAAFALAGQLHFRLGPNSQRRDMPGSRDAESRNAESRGG